MLAPATALAFLASSASAALNVATPFNSQLGSLHFPVSCNVLGGKAVIDSVITATAPLYAQAGQKIFYSDVSVTLKIPKYLAAKAGAKAGYTADATLQAKLVLGNSVPAQINAFGANGASINGVSISPNSDTTIRVPASGVLPSIGPVTVQSANADHTIKLGVVTASIVLKNENGATVKTIPLTCPLQDPEILIGIVNVTPKNGTQPPFKPRVNKVPNFPAQPPAKEYGCFNFFYSCTVPGIDTYEFQLKPCGGTFAAQKPGAKFTLDSLTSQIIIGGKALDTIRMFFPSAASITTTVSEFNILATNASPGTLNLFANKPYKGTFPIPPAPKNVTVNIPTGTNVFTAGPFTAGNTVGNRMFLSIGTAMVATQFKDGDGTDLGTLNLECKPFTPLNLIGILISNKAYPTYTSTAP